SYGEKTFTLAAVPHCDSAALTPATETQEVGTPVSLTASSTGCGTPAYQYWLHAPYTMWTAKRSFSFDPTFSWSSTGVRPGTYYFRVWANEYGYPVTAPDASAISTITLTGCATAALTSSTGATSPGVTVKVTATSAGCSKPLYEFWVKYPNGAWYLKQGWGGATFNWSTAGLANGTYEVRVGVNQQGSSLVYLQAIGYTTIKLATCTSATLSPASGGAAVGATVPFTAGAAG